MANKNRNVGTLAREYTETAINVLGEIMLGGYKDKDRLAAAKELLDRGHGKAGIAVVAIPASKAMRERLVEMTDAELTQIIDGEFEEVPHEQLALPNPDSIRPTIDPEDDPLLW